MSLIISTLLLGGIFGIIGVFVFSQRAISSLSISRLASISKSVISLAMNYFTRNSNNNNNGKISNYAWGDDYHNIIKPRLNKLLNYIKSKRPDTEGIVCIDTSPVMEKVWAQKSGLGWIGKHTNLITRDNGSWVSLEKSSLI